MSEIFQIRRKKPIISCVARVSLCKLRFVDNKQVTGENSERDIYFDYP